MRPLTGRGEKASLCEAILLRVNSGPYCEKCCRSRNVLVPSSEFNDAMYTLVRRSVILVLLGALVAPAPQVWARLHRDQKRDTVPQNHRSSRHSHELDTSRNHCCVTGGHRMAHTAVRASQSTETAAEVSNVSSREADVDPFDDGDGKLKKGRRRGEMGRIVSLFEDVQKVRLAKDLLGTLRLRLAHSRRHLREVSVAVPHFGSGPCHSIPRPREGTTYPVLPNDCFVA